MVWRGFIGAGLLQRAAPVKIFGDLHGQFGDLMRLFEEYGTPSTAGDITYIDYLVGTRISLESLVLRWGSVVMGARHPCSALPATSHVCPKHVRTPCATGTCCSYCAHAHLLQ